MSVIVRAQEWTTAQVNGHLTPVRQVHRRWPVAPDAPHGVGFEPAVVTVSAPVHLGAEDVVAVLLAWERPYEDLADDATVRRMLADAVINWGSSEIEEARCHLLVTFSGALTEELSDYLAYCRRRTHEVFNAPTDATETTPPARVLPVEVR